MTEIIRLGGFDDDDMHAAEDLALPLIPELSAIARVRDALDHVATVRRGVVVAGPKGVGKTMAVRRAVQEFMDRERKKKALSESYQPRRVLMLRGIRARTYRDALIAILHEIVGASFCIKAHGRRKTDDELRSELILHALNQRLLTFVLDDAESFAPVVYELLRDIISDAEERDTSRYLTNAEGDGVFRASGIGMLLVGTLEVARKIRLGDEAHQRWVGTVEIGLCPAEQVGDVYLRWLPGFSAHVHSVTAAVWSGFITEHVTRKQGVYMRLLENHTRLYFRRMVRNTAETLTRVSCPFREQLFLLTLQEARWSIDKKDGGTK